jgi:hypothetical protein
MGLSHLPGFEENLWFGSRSGEISLSGLEIDDQ